MDKPVAPELKKPYSPPKVTIYGTVRELTLHQGIRGKRDNSKNPRQNRTKF
jgi:hypothetical protein